MPKAATAGDVAGGVIIRVGLGNQPESRGVLRATCGYLRDSEFYAVKIAK